MLRKASTNYVHIYNMLAFSLLTQVTWRWGFILAKVLKDLVCDYLVSIAGQSNIMLLMLGLSFCFLNKGLLINNTPDRRDEGESPMPKSVPQYLKAMAK